MNYELQTKAKSTIVVHGSSFDLHRRFPIDMLAGGNQ